MVNAFQKTLMLASKGQKNGALVMIVAVSEIIYLTAGNMKRIPVDAAQKVVKIIQSKIISLLHSPNSNAKTLIGMENVTIPPFFTMKELNVK